MNLTCSYCQTPFTLGMATKVAALQRMHAENLHHYDAHCPRCGRANAVSRERLEMFTPGWKDAIQETASEAVPVSSPEPAAPQPTPPQMPSVPAPIPAPAKAPVKPVVKNPVAKKPAKKVAKAEPKKAVKKTAPKKTKKK